MLYLPNQKICTSFNISVIVDDIKIEEEEIARKYDEGALPLVTI